MKTDWRTDRRQFLPPLATVITPSDSLEETAGGAAASLENLGMGRPDGLTTAGDEEVRGTGRPAALGRLGVDRKGGRKAYSEPGKIKDIDFNTHILLVDASTMS